MKIIYSPRQSGKTTQLIEWLKEKPDRILLVHSREYVWQLVHQYPELDGRIVTWNDFLHKRREFNQFPDEIKRVAIDNAEFFFRDFIHAPIDVITMSKIEEHEN